MSCWVTNNYPPKMPRRKRSEEQIVYALRQVAQGAKIGDDCRQLGVSDQTYFRWKK